jgi:hypothetical protein
VSDIENVKKKERKKERKKGRKKERKRRVKGKAQLIDEQRREAKEGSADQ